MARVGWRIVINFREGGGEGAYCPTSSWLRGHMPLVNEHTHTGVPEAYKIL